MNRRKTAPPRGVLNTATADPRRYQHARYHPSPDLELYVEHYWSVAWELRGLAPERAETLPHPSVHMIFERPVGGRIAGVARGKFTRVLEGKGGVLDDPTRSSSPVSNTRSNFACNFSGTFAISSRNSVPLSANSNRPTRSTRASVNAPFT